MRARQLKSPGSFCLKPSLSGLGLGLRPSGFRLRSSSYDRTRRPHTQGSTFRVALLNRSKVPGSPFRVKVQRLQCSAQPLAAEAASSIEKETVVSYKRRLWPEKRPV